MEVEELLSEKLCKASSLERSSVMEELGFNMKQAPLQIWKFFHKHRERFKAGELDTACCTSITDSLRIALEQLDADFAAKKQDITKNEIKSMLESMIFFVTEFMGSVCLNTGPNRVYNILSHLYTSSPRTVLHVELVSDLQNCIVDYHVAVPQNSELIGSDREVKFWQEGITYALEVSSFDPRSRQVITLCRSIADSFFGGGKLASVNKKLNDMTGHVDESNSNPAYLFDLGAVKLVKKFTDERGALMGYSFLWALLDAFLLRIADEKHYLSALMLLVHFLQAVGAPIKCMPTASILEYPQSQLDETERLFHVVKLLEIYIASGLYHPSVLVTKKKRFRGNLVFNDLFMFVLKHPGKGSNDWYRALHQLTTVASTVVAPKLKILLQNAWFDCVPDDAVAQNEFLVFLVDMYDKLHRSADFYTRILGAVNDYLESDVPEPSLSKPLLLRMRISFAALDSDDVIKIWSDYVRYIFQALQKWKESSATINRGPQIFVLKVFFEFMQHCPLIPFMEVHPEQQIKTDDAIEDTLKLIILLRSLMDEMPEETKDVLPHYIKLTQQFTKCRFVRGHYLDKNIDLSIDDAAHFQEDLVALVQTLKENEILRLDSLCASVKLTDDSKSRANRCLEKICANFGDLDWQLLLCRHPQVIECASERKVQLFVTLLYQYVKERNVCSYVKTQLFRSDSRQVLAFVKLIATDLAKAVAQEYPQLVDTLDIDNLETAVCWNKMLVLLMKSQPVANLSEIVAQSKYSFNFVPVFCLPPAFRVKLFGLTMIVTLCHSAISEGFFADACFFLEDLSCALKFKGICSDSDLALICQLATLCLERVLALYSSLCIHQPLVKRVLDLIHFVHFTAAKRIDSVEAVQTVFKQFKLDNDAQFYSALLLVETFNQVRYKIITSEDLAGLREFCKKRINKGLAKCAFKLQNMIFIASKYAEVFGVANALEVQSVKLAFQSAGETLLALKSDGAAMRLWALALREGKKELYEAIPTRAAVFCAVLVGGENEQVLIKTMNTKLANELWPVVSSVMDNFCEISLFVESVATDAVDVTFASIPFHLRTLEGIVTGDDVYNRCLAFLPVMLKYCDEQITLAIIKKVSSLVANRGGLRLLSLRIDLCSLILDAASRRRPSIEALTLLYSTISRLPVEQLIDAPSESTYYG
ncbi:hypothetical protein BIW11_02441 [Tropilaelaps mercedesae]|uniref:Uncharacterized protein n=1 Tax=Tropilaelaps mercedesae TaxID=418985 RepID=A0A1V9Y368_9ACAR|nr:hypothetical protein BIW11_02441 [Tropilaelaps mercedesae]